ncbi:MAG: DUF3119 family protein [Thermosynechococcaceae cyanobacterium]
MGIFSPNISKSKLQTVILKPSYWVPFGVALVSIPFFFVSLWTGAVVLVFAGFLGFQAATIQFQFTDKALELHRGEKQLRSFPYADWLHWQIFWPPIPILFYFKEVNSIHFTPMLFDAKTLQACLEERCPRKLPET